MIWEVELSNGEVVREQPEEVASWRWLRDRCRREGLTIKELRYNGNAIHRKADAYFAFFEGIGFMKTGLNIMRRAIGCFYRDGEKYRIHWYDAKQGTQLQTEANFVEGWESREIAEEMRIERCPSNSATS